MITLRNYQQEIINQTKKYLKDGHKSVAVQSPTGSGKTVIFSYIVKNALAKSSRVLIITDRIELLTETGGTLSEFGIEYTKIQAGLKYPPEGKCIVAMSQTLRRRIKDKNFPKAWGRFFKSFNLVIVDENHKQEFNDFFMNEVFNGATILGFSATPERSGKARQLADDYSQIVHGPTTRELIKLGWLVPDEYYAAKSIDVKGLRKNKDDYAEADMYARFNTPQLYGDAVDKWKSHAYNKITLTFCVNIQHCVETCKAFNDAGIKAKFLTSPVNKPILPQSPTPGQRSRYDKHLAEYNNWLDAYYHYSGTREQILSDWKAGKFYVLINAGILTTGFNFKAIEAIQLIRVTMSDPLWLQICGRGSRPYEGPHPVTGENWIKNKFIIIDHGNHNERLAPYREPRKYNLIHKESKGGGAAPVKECGAKKRAGVKPNEMGYYADKDGRPGCGAYINASVMICPYCGYKYDTDKEIIEAEFARYDYDIEPARNVPIREVSEVEKIIKEGEIRGYRDGWALHQISAKFGFSGIKEYAEKKRYSRGWAYKTAARLNVKTV